MSINIEKFNEGLVERFDNEVLHESEQAKSPECIDRIWEEASWTAKQEGKRLLDVLDFRYLFEQTCPESVRSAFASGKMNGDNADAIALKEHVASTIKASGGR